MGKRKHKDKKSHRSKKRRREKRYYLSDSSSSSSEDEYYDAEQYRYPEINNTPDYEDIVSIPGSEKSIEASAKNDDNIGEKNLSVAPSADVTYNEGTTLDNNLPSTSAEAPALPTEILEALGDPKGKEEVLGPKIQEEIASRWGRVLVDGLSKDRKQEILASSLIPDNFRLAKAPLLNPEVIPALSDSSKNRDKIVERLQNQLGLGISKLTYLATDVIEGNVEKLDILKKISEASQILLDLHNEQTKARRRMVITSLDKKFVGMIADAKRDTYLFGANLGEKIKASKTAEMSGLQIKRKDTSNTRTHPQQGNWRGPPRAQAQRGYRQGGQRNRYPTQSNRRPPQSASAVDRQPRGPAKQTPKSTKT
ncbi:uncharacterized protein LOC126375795 [Pectinophora gossypiella]|uniref:uncharacterized protein LOC126375795 n=1 Tax=Pectinophora gossypiella TaxID=13191 RepID=UPI00214E1B51|nr:uncharacterized protein LOC126375795 [Pectinophora gossypiella]